MEQAVQAYHRCEGSDDMGDFALTEDKINSLREIDVRSVDPDTLRDIRDVKVNVELPKRERMLDFIKQIGNPYCYRHGKYVVKVSYTDTDVTLQDRLLSYIRSKC